MRHLQQMIALGGPILGHASSHTRVVTPTVDPGPPVVIGDPYPYNLGDVFPAYDPNQWKGQYPWNSSGLYTGTALEAWPMPWVSTPPGGVAVADDEFPVNCQSARVSGSGFPRFERREMNLNGSNAGWNLLQGLHVQRTKTQIASLPTRNADGLPGRLVYNQTHQTTGSNEPCRIMFDGATPSTSGTAKPPPQGDNIVYVMVDTPHGAASEIRRFLYDDATSTIQLRITDWSKPWETAQVIDEGILQVHALYDGSYYKSEQINLNAWYTDALTNLAYFKHGNYLQLGALGMTSPTPAETGVGLGNIKFLGPTEVLHTA